MGNRTDELKQSGANRVAGGGSDAPFVKWPEKGGKHYAYVEGKALSLWEGKYGAVLTMTADHGQSIRAVSGTEDEPQIHKIEKGMTVNVGLNYTSLKDFAPKVQIGHEYHIAFEGWEKSRGGNTYRVFEVLDLGGPPPDEASEPDYSDFPEDEEGDDLPF